MTCYGGRYYVRINIFLHPIKVVEKMAREYKKNRAYDIIHKKIINCEYPPGSILNESELIELIGTSRTPIRDALNKLEQEGLVTIIPKKCIWVNEITLDSIIEEYEARMIIEPEFLKRYALEIPKEYWADYLERCKKAVILEDKISLDEEFHNKLYSKNKNRYLKIVIEMLVNMEHRNRSYKSNGERATVGLQEHIKIVQCILESDLERAAENLKEHLKNASIFAEIKYLKYR